MCTGSKSWRSFSCTHRQYNASSLQKTVFAERRHTFTLPFTIRGTIIVISSSQAPQSASPTPGQRHGQQPVSGTADPGVVKQDKSSRGSVDTAKTRCDPQRVRLSSGERPIGAAKGKQRIPRPCATPPPPEGTLGYITCAQAADSTKRRKKMGLSVAYKTIGTFLSQNMGHEDACGWATDQCKAVDTQRYANGRR